MGNGEFDFSHALQQSNMLIISPNRCIRRLFAVCISSWGVSSREAARFRFEWFDRSCFSVGDVLLFALSNRVQSRGADVIIDGILWQDSVVSYFV